MSGSIPSDAAIQRTSASSEPQIVCWSRMQAEAGQPLEEIILRKESERLAGGGLFFWGVGNAPAKAIPALAKMGSSVRLILSKMKSKPKRCDTSPTSVVMWTQYVDSEGVVRPLPDSALITSRGASATGPKRSHFALMCRSTSPLKLRNDRQFDPGAYRNLGGKGGKVGSSQVTALLTKVDAEQRSNYEINLEAALTGSYWVRLTDPLKLGRRQIADISAGPKGDEDWLDFVARLRDKASSSGGMVERSVSSSQATEMRLL